MYIIGVMSPHKDDYSSNRIRGSDHGISYFSILSSISLGVLINLLTVNAFTSIFSLSKVVRTHQQTLHDRQIIKLKLQHITNAYDAHPFTEISPLFHAHTVNSVIPLRGKHAALQGSTALFSLSTQFSKGLFVKEYDGTSRLTACAVQKLSSDFSGYFLAFGIDGITPLTATKIASESESCLRIDYYKSRHPFIPSSLGGRAILLLPINESALLYIDENLTLRHLAFFHGAIKENQPIRKLQKPARFSFGQKNAYWSFFAHIDALPLIQQSTRIPRVDTLDILFNYQSLR